MLPKHAQGSTNGVIIHHAVSTRLGGWGRDNGSTLGQLLAGFFEFVGLPNAFSAVYTLQLMLNDSLEF